MSKIEEYIEALEKISESQSKLIDEYASHLKVIESQLAQARQDVCNLHDALADWTGRAYRIANLLGLEQIPGDQRMLDMIHEEVRRLIKYCAGQKESW